MVDEADGEALQLARAAEIVTHVMFQGKQHFNGSFSIGYQDSAVGSSLTALVEIMLIGATIRNRKSTFT